MKNLSEKWDRRYLELAKYVSEWSKDPRAKVGAVLLDERTWPIALGYNGFPSGVADDATKLADADIKNEMVVHAEQNVLLCAGARARDGTLFVFGKPVCSRCAVLIIQAGIGRVVAARPEPDKYRDSNSHSSGAISVRMFEEAGIEFSPL